MKRIAKLVVLVFCASLILCSQALIADEAAEKAARQTGGVTLESWLSQKMIIWALRSAAASAAQTQTRSAQ